MSILSRFIEANQSYDAAIDAIERRDDSTALAAFNRALRLNPHYTLAYLNRGKLYQRWYRDSKAAADYESVLRLDKNDDQTRYRLAVLDERDRHFRAGAHHFALVLKHAGWAKQSRSQAALKELKRGRYRLATVGLHRLLRRLDFH